MKAFKALLNRELHAYLMSPVAYAFWGVFVLLCGTFFYRSLSYFSYLSLRAGYDPSLQGSLNANELVLRPLSSNITLILVFLIPLLTMRTFAEEKKSGTFELILSYPVSDLSIILAKAAAAVLVMIVALSLAGLFPLILFIVGAPEAGPTFCGYLGLALLSVSFISIGLFFSCLTENQIVAAVTTSGCLLLLWSLSWASSFIPGKAGAVLTRLSVYDHFSGFSKGVIASNDVIYFLDLALFFIFLTVQAMRKGTRYR